MKVIKITKFEGRVLFAFGVLILVLCSISFVRWTSMPDIHRDEVVSVEADNLTSITMSNIDGAHTLSGSFVVREGTIDFIITSSFVATLTTLVSLGRTWVGQGVYRLDNVTEDRFDIELNRPGELLGGDEVWYLVFDNRNSSEPKTIDLSYKLHPHEQDTLMFTTIGLFVAGISVIFVAAVVPRKVSSNINKQAYPADECNPKP